MNNLIYRRQFLLTRHEPAIDDSWKKRKLSKVKIPFNLFIHPDLDVSQAENGEMEIILLGYVLNPHNAAETTMDIVNRLAGAGNFRDILNLANSLCGRFAVIYNDPGSIKVFHDATGFREVFYINQGDVIACGSTPNILAEYHNLTRDTGKQINDFYNSPQLNRPERIWIGTGTIYSHVNHLLPNHYVDLLENKAVRFWPDKVRDQSRIDEATRRMAGILKGTYDAATRQFTLQQGITSGWDTKLLLAACREHISRIHFYFNRGFKSDNRSEKSVDLDTATRICRDYDIPLEIVETRDLEIDPEFEGIYYRNNVLARPKLLKIYYSCHKNCLDGTVTVSGTTGNEILRLVQSIGRNLNKETDLARLFGYQDYPYAVNEIRQWLDGTRHLQEMNYPIIDLFYWEQMVGNWGGLGGSEQDIVREELRPFNNRELYSIYTSLKDKFRYRDFPSGHVRIIRILWKELLDYPMDVPQAGLKKTLRFIGLERIADKVHSNIHKTLFQIILPGLSRWKKGKLAGNSI